MTIYRGVRYTSNIVYITVPVPFVVVFIFLMRGCTLKNSDYGFRMYLKGYIDDEAVDYSSKLFDAKMWTDACSQIFFSLSICTGVMISYSSYNRKEQPIISNAFYVAFIDTGFSLLAGLSVFSFVGYLQGFEDNIQDKISSIGLAFIAYPTAIESLSSPNGWTILLAIMLFFLGIDT